MDEMRKKQDCMVSVTVLTYNHEKYIRQALDSILMQTVNFSYEILVGDDASTDGTLAILREYEGKYPEIIRVFASGQNQGTTRNAYRLFLQARGKYLASCEGDDFWTVTNKLQRQVDFLECHPQYIGCSHGVRCVDKDGKPNRNNRLRWVTNKRVFTLGDFKGFILPGHSSTLLRRNIFLRPQSDYSVYWRYSKYIGDRTAALLWSMEGDFYRLKQTMSCYRKIADAESGNVTSIMYLTDENKNHRELELTQKLEDLANQGRQKKLNFDYYRCRIFLSAAYRVLVMNAEADRLAAVEAWKQLRYPALAIVRVPFLLIDMIVEKIRYKLSRHRENIWKYEEYLKEHESIKD